MTISTNETLIQTNLISIKNAQGAFMGAQGRYGDFSELVDAGHLSSTYLTPRDMNGYSLELNVHEDFYSVRANPTTPGVTGNRYFYLDDSGAIRVQEEIMADSASPLV